MCIEAAKLSFHVAAGVVAASFLGGVQGDGNGRIPLRHLTHVQSTIGGVEEKPENRGSGSWGEKTRFKSRSVVGYPFARHTNGGQLCLHSNSLAIEFENAIHAADDDCGRRVKSVQK